MTGPAFPGTHLLHAAPGHSGEGVGHEPRAEASEQPYLPIHLHDVLGCKRAEVATSQTARAPTPGSLAHVVSPLSHAAN